MLAYILIAVGGALGSMARYFISGLVAAMTQGTFPFGTLGVNITGALAIGLFAAMSSPDGRLYIAPSGRQFLMVGICGGYTTFSTFSLETLNLMRDGEWLSAVANAVFSVLLCIVGVWLGSIAGSMLNRGV
ncbi:MAG TPA: fluoride efflux transporter CrcB [Candidatus Binataceae bacterium]